MTPKQKQVMEFISDQVRHTGICPTHREIMAHVGSKSFSSITGMCSALVEEGYLRRAFKRVRPFEPTKKWLELKKREEVTARG